MSVTLAPIGWTMLATAPRPSRAEILIMVNRMVNHAIDWVPPTSAAEPWRIGPKAGPCHDFAVTKRWLLQQLGFAASELLLCECVTEQGEEHLVLRAGDVVLDNRTDLIGPMRYRVVRQQSADNPDIWVTP